MKFYSVYLKDFFKVEILELDETVLKRLVDCFNSGTRDVVIQGKVYDLLSIDTIRIFQIDNLEEFHREKSSLLNQLFGQILGKEYLQSFQFISRFGREVTDELILASWQENWRKNINKSKELLKTKTYINITRLEELQSISSTKFDCSKLIKFCEEINKCFNNDCLLSVAMLVRAIIDHIPPIFDRATFNEVTNNYGTKSFKDSMNNLNNSLRKIADSYLHTHIRSKEVLPNETQVDFSRDLDVLLGEICRVLK